MFSSNLAPFSRQKKVGSLVPEKEIHDKSRENCLSSRKVPEIFVTMTHGIILCEIERDLPSGYATDFSSRVDQEPTVQASKE